MELPQSILNISNLLLEKFSLNQLKDAAETLSLGYREDKRSGQSFIKNNVFAAAYFIARMPATAAAVSAALKHTFNINKSSPKTVLDMGAGTGATAFSLEGLSVDKITFIERQPEMLALGKKVTDALGLSAEWHIGRVEDTVPQKYDMVVTSYMLNELPESVFQSAVKKLWNATDDMLLIVENGAKGGFDTLKRAREILKELGGYVIAPCPNLKACPLEDDDWCHFTARVQRTKLHKALKGGDAPYEDEKFCFLAVSRQPSDVCKARVLRHPKISSGKIELRLCTENGIEDRIVTKRDKQNFKRARKISAGDQF